MKKLASLLLTLVMITSCFSAMASEVTTPATGSITINDAVDGQTYTIYQILDLESYNAGSNAYAYKANSAWTSFIASDAIKDVYLSTDAQGYVTWVGESTDARAAEFAKLAKAHLDTVNGDEDTANDIANQGSTTATSTTVTFTGLDLGYYLIDTTLGTLCSLDTTNPNVTMEEKNEAPTITKKVEEDSKANTENAWGESNDADIDQVVNFKATITVEPGAENYAMHDSMSAGLTFDANSVKVLVDNVEVSKDNYTVTEKACSANTNCRYKDACTFVITFTDEYIATIIDKTIVVTYSATLNENAVIGSNGNPNKTDLVYGDQNHPSHTPEDETKTYTWEMDIEKFTKVNNVETKLAGATFTLSKNADGTNPIKFTRITETTGEGDSITTTDTDTYKVDAEGTIEAITTDEDGVFKLIGLDADTYYLTETAAPQGYNNLAGAIKITIDNQGNVATIEGETSTQVDVIKVENNTGAELPSTGGMGTTILYVGGGILVLAAIVLLIAKRRTSAE